MSGAGVLRRRLDFSCVSGALVLDAPAVGAVLPCLCQVPEPPSNADHLHPYMLLSHHPEGQQCATAMRRLGTTSPCIPDENSHKKS